MSSVRGVYTGRAVRRAGILARHQLADSRYLRRTSFGDIYALDTLKTWMGFQRCWSTMSTQVMKSLRFTQFGPPSVLRIEELPIPEPGEGEALVHVKAAAINPSDIGNVAGRFKHTTLPRTPGRDFAGIVVKGKRHDGEEVWGSGPKLGIVRDGSHAEYV